MLLALVPPITACPGAVEISLPPNVLLVTIDTLRADHVGVYGYDVAHTPHLDSLAARGVLFENAMASVPITLPSHASLLTGQHPPRHGVRHNGLHRISDQSKTLAEVLADGGYQTGAVVGAVVLAGETGLRQGFAHYDDAGSRLATEESGFLERPAIEVSDRALALLRELSEPFFLWVHYYDPHEDWRAPAAWSKRFVNRPYDAEIAYTDAQLGRVLRALESDGRLGRTLVVLTSDHGESLGEHGDRTHSYGLHETTLHVPLMIVGPDIPAGKRVVDVVSLVDLAPTLLALTGMKPLANADGRSLQGFWTGSPPPHFGAYSETLATRLDHGWAPLHSWRSSTHRCVQSPRPELYELADDPDAMHNLLRGKPMGDARVLAVEYQKNIDDVMSHEIAQDRQTVDASMLRRLQSLGYAVTAHEVERNDLDPKDGLRLLDRYHQAVTHLKNGEPVPARRLFEEVLAGMPGSALTHSQLARALAEMGEPEAALEHARLAVDLVPDSGQQLARLAMLELQTGRVAAAAQHFDQAHTQDPASPQAQAGVMWNAARSGDEEAAQRHEARALELDPDGWKTRQLLAMLWIQLGRPDRAWPLIEAALKLRPEEKDLHRDAVVTLVQLGRAEETARHLAVTGQALASPSFSNRLIIAHARAGDTQRAVTLFETIVERHPGYEPAKRNLASLLQRINRP